MTEEEEAGWPMTKIRHGYHKQVDEGSDEEGEEENPIPDTGDDIPPEKKKSEEQHLTQVEALELRRSERERRLSTTLPFNPYATPEKKTYLDLEFAPHAPDPQSPYVGNRFSENASQVEYICTGKLTLFPLSTLFFGVGAGVALLQAEKPYLGLLLASIALALFIALVTFIVVKITFTFDLELLIVKKSGVLRSKTLQFSIAQSSLHYFRTHFSEDQCWLQLIIKESGQYYQIFSWKGTGTQKDRFLALFVRLQRELIKWKTRNAQAVSEEDFANTEILSRKEVNLIHPFTHRLKALSNTGIVDEVLNASESALCVEDIPILDYDNFFKHFSLKKVVARDPLNLQRR